jgi:acetate kinase
MSHNLILAANAGSSSLKLSLFLLVADRKNLNPNEEPVFLLATYSVSNIGTSFAKLSYSLDVSLPNRQADLPSSVNSHTAAFEHFLQILFTDPDFTSSGYERHNITHVCHRVVYGGDFADSVIVENPTYERLEALSDLAPLCVALICRRRSIHQFA